MKRLAVFAACLTLLFVLAGCEPGQPTGGNGADESMDVYYWPMDTAPAGHLVITPDGTGMSLGGGMVMGF